MAWRLELFRSDEGGSPERRTVIELGEIGAPADLEGVGFDLMTSQRILCELQHAVVALQEQALKEKAMKLRRADPTLSLKDYRTRSVQTLFGTLVIRVPRLVRSGSRLPAPCIFSSLGRSTAQYDQLRSRLGAFMSFRMAERLIGDLFPLAAGCARSTIRRNVLRQAADRERGLEVAVPEDGRAATSIDLGIDTTFARSSAAAGARHHEVLIGVG